MRKALGRALPVSLAVVVASAGVAYATGARSASPTTIVGCAKNVNGQLRIVSVPGDCGPSEHAVQFASPPDAGGPAAVTVDCAAGQSVQQALADTAAATQVDITIKGTCNESVRLSRDDVALHAAAPGDGLAQAVRHGGVLTVDGSRHVVLDRLTISGGQWGLSVLNGSSVQANGLHVVGASDQDVTVNGGTSLELDDATVDGADTGVSAQSGGAVTVIGGTISNSQTFGVQASQDGSITLGGGVLVTGSGFHGVFADQGGSIMVQSATVQNSGGTGVFAFTGGTAFVAHQAVVQNNRQGGVGANAGTVEVDGRVTANFGCGGICAFNGGRVTLQGGALVDANHGSGVEMSVGSTLAVGNDVSIVGNDGDGVHLHDTTVGGFDSTDHITGNGGWGVICDGAPAVAQVTHGPNWAATVTGNGAGQIACPSS